MKFFKKAVDTYLDDTERGAKMSIYSFAVRPVNMLRSPMIRAASPHTTTWGLARLSHRADSSEMKIALCHNLHSRIRMATVSVGSLYGVDRQILGVVLEKTTVTALTRLVKTAKPGKFEIPFTEKGKDIVEVFDSTGKASKQERTYEKDTAKPHQGYNLPFFFWMRGVVGAGNWAVIMQSIATDDRLLAKNLGELEVALGRAQEFLRKHYPLPTTSSVVLDRGK